MSVTAEELDYFRYLLHFQVYFVCFFWGEGEQKLGNHLIERQCLHYQSHSFSV